MELSNQHERLIFLGAMIEGEGCVNLVSIKRPNGRFRYIASIDINNTAVELVNKTVETLKDVGVSPYVHWKYQSRKSDGMKYAPCACIRVAGFKRLAVFLPLIIPYLISKQGQAKLIHQFLDRRATKPQNAHYDEVDTILYDQVKVLNKKPSYKMLESSETNTWDPNIYQDEFVGNLGDDRVHASA